jgi:hypothetical protein
LKRSSFQVLPKPPVTLTLRRRLIPSWRRSLSESVASSRLSDLVGPDPTSVGFYAPATTALELAPYEVGCYVHLGSTLRFFQPLSGFLASSSFVALFHATTVRGVRPSEAFPRKNRVLLSKSLAPLQLSTGVLRRAHSCFITVDFTDAHTRGCVCLDSSPAMRFVFTHRGALPCSPELVRAEPSCSANFTCFEALFLLRVRSYRSRLPRHGRRSSLGFLPP